MKTLSKPRRRRQRGHGKTKDLIGRTIAQHVRFKNLYISKSSYAKQQREITTICAVCELKPRRQIILISIWNSTLLFAAVWDGRQKGRNSFFNRIFPWRCRPDCLRSLMWSYSKGWNQIFVGRKAERPFKLRLFFPKSHFLTFRGKPRRAG